MPLVESKKKKIRDEKKYVKMIKKIKKQRPSVMED